MKKFYLPLLISQSIVIIVLLMILSYYSGALMHFFVEFCTFDPDSLKMACDFSQSKEFKTINENPHP